MVIHMKVIANVIRWVTPRDEIALILGQTCDDMLPFRGFPIRVRILGMNDRSIGQCSFVRPKTQCFCRLGVELVVPVSAYGGQDFSELCVSDRVGIIWVYRLPRSN